MVNGNLGPSQARAEDYIAAGNDLAKAKTVLILLPQNPSLDAAAAALALYLSVSKVQKTVNIACANPLTVAFNRLYAVNKVKQEIGNKNLLISFDCPEESLEKVSYNIENNTFNLVVEKKSGYPALQTKDLKYNYTGVSADIVFILGGKQN